MPLNSPGSAPQLDAHTPLRRRVYEVLGASALLLAVGCQSPATEKAENESAPVKEHKADATPTSEPATKESECHIKGNISGSGEKLYHEPDGCPDYANVKINRKGERCFGSEEEARAAGWKKAGNCR